jgi:hypothetical protein
VTAHPAFAPYVLWLGRTGSGSPPDASTLNAWAREARLALPDGRPLSIAVQAADPVSAIEYERRVHRDGIIAAREGSWHDAFNVLAWLAFPRLKAALNARHVGDGEASTPNRRGRARDAATLLDESGIVLACDDSALGALLRAHAWRELFVDRRDDVRGHVAPYVVGHGMLDRLRAPYRALTAKALVVGIAQDAAVQAVDAAAAAIVERAGFDAGALTPLPLAALPGWDAERLGDTLFDDASVFRPKMLRSPRRMGGGAL